MGSNTLKTLSIVFSFYNEEEVLPILLKRVKEVLSRKDVTDIISDYELIFVNDRSTDNSLPLLLNEVKGDSRIKIINMSRNFGVSPCVLAGMKYSMGDFVIYMDCDLQDPPELIPELLKKWKTGDNVDVVHTVRTLREGEAVIKLLITKIGYRILHSISSLKLPIETGDFKLLSRRAVDHLIKFHEKRPFIRGLVCWVGFNQERIYYVRPARAAGESKFSVFGWKVISNFLESAVVSFSTVPLQIASFMGVMSMLASFTFIGVIITKMVSNSPVPTWTIILSAMFFLGAINFFCLGVIGSYLSNVFEESKNRPNYIVENTIGFPQENIENS